MNDLSKVRLVVTGRVQGVFFRHSTKQVAMSLSVLGFARNEPDGRVVVEAVGPRIQLQRLIEWCKHGPPSAQVEGVDVQWLPPTGEEYDGFEIR